MRPIDHIIDAPTSANQSGQIYAGTPTRGVRARRRHAQAGAGSDEPRLVQWPREPVTYHEGSTLVLSCSLASAPSQAPRFAWFKQSKPLNGPQAGAAASQLGSRLSIESLADYSILRLADLRPSDSAVYTCAASGQQGHEDRTSSQVQVVARLKWSSAPGSPELQVIRAGQPAVLECGAAGQPRPRIRWFRLSLAPSGTKPAAPYKLDEARLRAIMIQSEQSGQQQWQRSGELGASTKGKLPAPPLMAVIIMIAVIKDSQLRGD